MSLLSETQPGLSTNLPAPHLLPWHRHGLEARG